MLRIGRTSVHWTRLRLAAVAPAAAAWAGVPALWLSVRRMSDIHEEYKAAMARVASQAMVLTAGVEPLALAEPAALHGMTLSSTTLLSVHPTPLLLFNLHLPSYTSHTLHRLGHLALHVLPPSVALARLARIFANAVKRPPGGDDDDDVFHEKTTPFDGLAEGRDWRFVAVGAARIPVLSCAERIFLCRKRLVYEIDAHEIWVVEVVRILRPPAAPADSLGGLLYHNRAFHRIGGTL